MIGTRFAAAALLIVAATSAGAQTRFGWSGDWEIVRGPALCTMRYVDRDGTTEILITDTARGYATLEVRGAAWSYADGQEYGVVLTTKRWTVSSGTGLGLPVKEGRGGFSMQFLSGGVPGMVAPRRIRVQTFRPKLRDRYFVMPSGASAVEELARCVKESRRDELGSGAPAVTPARLRDLPERLITQDDYPAYAIRGQISGTVTVRLSVTALGYANACVVTASSGDASLDRAACTLYQRRAAFDPARDAKGRATTGTYDLTKHWIAPPPPPLQI
jgi:TonB family protein